LEPENSEAAAILREETVPRLMRAFRQLVAAGEEIDVAGARELLKRLSRETRLSGPPAAA
jgi:hypothetical protein